jgi:hypothetical protein
MIVSEAKIKAGDVCRCSIGKLGMVTREGRQRVAYEDGNDGEAYVGICLTDGKPWCSRNPERICTLAGLKRNILEAQVEIYLAGQKFGPEDDPEDAARWAYLFAAGLP